MQRILHIDMDAFFAAIELKRHPELIGEPVVVGGRGDPTKRGVVSTASYEARQFGIHSAMPLRTALKLCPQAVFLPVDYKEYSRVSEQIKRILHEFSPIMEDGGIDEAYLDITRVEQPSEAIARGIKNRIWSAQGLTCSIGIAPNKLLAKIASDLEKPDGLTILTQEDVPARIWPLPAKKLYGVGPKTDERLKRMGIRTIGEIASASRQVLVSEFGASHGNYLYEASRGIDDRPLVTNWVPKSSSRETTFEKDIGNRQILAETLIHLTDEVVEEIRKGGFESRTVTVKVRFSDFKTHTRGKTLNEAIDDAGIIRSTALSCLERFEFKKRVRLIGIRLSGLRIRAKYR
ncbi:DNA polymerase IV [Desulfoferrobacter suflitae]|uniref:DNA polymerase IV n=1 Tax=Desulfoferrobacter suflitae TaxID=2865782 RepID=UPI0021643566|nr:DNA polymerase IV [Desulfoferrobacter suflitae]MCK8600145.1 DNA polymerase IV [Desulfoferrobacter suflitae]